MRKWLLVRMLKTSVKIFNLFRRLCPKLQLDLSGVDFTNCVLDGANLNGANMKGAQLGGASVQGADLRNADLTGSELWRNALTTFDMQLAMISGRDFRGARLNGSLLEGADFRGAKLRAIDFVGINVIGGLFSEDDEEVVSLRRIQKQGLELPPIGPYFPESLSPDDLSAVWGSDSQSRLGLGLRPNRRH